MIRENQLKTTKLGSSGELMLSRYTRQSRLKDWGLETMERMRPLAELMEERYPGTLSSLESQKAKLLGLKETLSQRIVRTLRETGDDYVTLIGRLSHAHKESAAAFEISQERYRLLESLADASHVEQRKLESEDTVDFEMYMKKWT